jgi:hypothetical protein
MPIHERKKCVFKHHAGSSSDTVITYAILQKFSGFGGLVVSMLASGTQDRGFTPDQSRQIFPVEKIHSMPSFRGEVK